MSDVFCKQCGVTDDQQAKCDVGCGVFCEECDEFIDVEEDTEEGKMNYRKRHGAPLGLMGNSRVSRRFRLLFCERVRALDRDHAFASKRSGISFLFFIRAFYLLVVTDQLRHEVWLRAGILGVLVAKELGDATRQQFPDQHTGCRMRQGSLSLTPRWFHRLLQSGWTPTSSLIRDFQIHSIQKSVFTR